MSDTFLTRKGSRLAAGVAGVVSSDDLKEARTSLRHSVSRRERQTGRLLTRLCGCGEWKGLHARTCAACFRKAMVKDGTRLTEARPDKPQNWVPSRQGMVGQAHAQPTRPMYALVDGEWKEV